MEDSFDLKVRADYLTLGLRENGRNSTARILNFHLVRNPEIALLWNMADNYSNLLNRNCPSLPVHPDADPDGGRPGENPQRSQPEVHGPGEKVEDLLCQMVSVRGERGEGVGELRQRLGSGQSAVVSYFLNITAFCNDNNETALEVEQDILNSFRKNGFELISPRFNHMRNFLTCLPFMAGKGLFKQLKEAGVVQRAESFNVANLMR
ncbi:conjugal transfer ATP-binding protein TraC [Escherichia coli]|nr:conjugal transfer ATP-binding protein TraC [Escherichia coli]